MARDWKRAGIQVQERRAKLGIKTAAEFAARAHVSIETIGNIENGRRTNYTPGIRAAVEDVLGWAQGSFMAVADGAKPTLKPDPLLERVQAAWPRLDDQARRMVVAAVEAGELAWRTSSAAAHAPTTGIGSATSTTRGGNARARSRSKATPTTS